MALLFKTLVYYVCEFVPNVCNISMYISFVIHLPEDGRMSGRNIQEVYSVYNILSLHLYAFVVSDIICNC
jgi:hypothetical protein